MVEISMQHNARRHTASKVVGKSGSFNDGTIKGRDQAVLIARENGYIGETTTNLDELTRAQITEIHRQRETSLLHQRRTVETLQSLLDERLSMLRARVRGSAFPPHID